MSKGRVGFHDTHERDRLEEAQSILAVVCLDLDEISLRMRQAVRRTAIVSDVLSPAIKRLDVVISDIDQAKVSLEKAWNEGQKKKWRD